ncbi:Zn-finger domain-containing protein [Mycena floridula]|nr:Zn-finger domain-containing protein [Mycena floridula]
MPRTLSSCKYCHRDFSTEAGVNHHQANAAACRQKRDTEFQHLRAEVAQGVSEPRCSSPHLPPAPIDIEPPASPVAYQDGPEDIDARVPGRRVTIRDVEDLGDGFSQPFPEGREAGATFGHDRTTFQKIRDEQVLKGYEILGPFKDDDEWELAKWLLKNVGHNATEDFLKLGAIKNKAQPSYKNKRQYLNIIDELPIGADWNLDKVTTLGDIMDGDGVRVQEELEFWWRDPVECIKELMGNPMFRDVMKYAPERLYEDKEGTVPVINEMWTAAWWWELQKQLPVGATAVPMIISSDKTRLSMFRGDKSAWPVYLTIGNIAKETRREASAHATVLIGYLPIGKFSGYTKKAAQMMESVKEAGKTGVNMTCSDGHVRWNFPVVAAYVADYPEQCLVACCKENRCPICKVGRKERESNDKFAYRDPAETLELLSRKETNPKNAAFKAEWKASGVRPVFQPFWHDLPYSNVFQMFTPDLLHQLHKGVFKDHLVSWVTALVGEEEIDERFKSMTNLPGLRHFKNGISSVSQWTGSEYKAMEQVFLPLLVGARVDEHVILAVKAVIDFIFYSSLQSHTSRSLAALSACLDAFHKYKDVFLDHEIRTHFNIPKIHSMQHYVALIRHFGSADGFNTESPERLHIDYAKNAYRASNGKDYIIQMTRWLQRQEAVDRFASYLSWCRHGALHALDNSASLAVEEGDIEVHMVPTPISSTTNVIVPAFKVAATHPPRLRAVPVASIVTGNRASCFLPALQAFLLGEGSVSKVYDFDAINLFGRLTIQLPRIVEVSKNKLKNTVRASPPVPATPCSPAQGPELDFALVRTGEINDRTIGTPLEGLRVAHVKVIFALPKVYGLVMNKPLAYVEWFTPFATPDTVSGLYTIKRSTRMHQVYGEIIEADRIARNCHPTPKFGAVKESTWTASNVIEECSQFLFNPYADMHLFCMLKVNRMGCV